MAEVSFDISLKDLLKAGSHFGHTTTRFNPKIKDYVYTIKDKVVIFDLAKTRRQLIEAAKFLFKTAEAGGEIVFVGTKRQAAEIVKEEAIKSKSYYVNSRWWGGTLTNWKQISKRIKLLEEDEKKLAEGEFDHYTKLERLKIEKKLQRLRRFLGGLVGFSGQPSALVVVDVKKEMTAVREAKKLGIPVVAIVDSNVDPELVTYPIPANDDAVASIKLILSFLSGAILEGRNVFAKKGEKKTTAKTRAAKKVKAAKNENKKVSAPVEKNKEGKVKKTKATLTKTKKAKSKKIKKEVK